MWLPFVTWGRQGGGVPWIVAGGLYAATVVAAAALNLAAGDEGPWSDAGGLIWLAAWALAILHAALTWHPWLGRIVLLAYAVTPLYYWLAG